MDLGEALLAAFHLLATGDSAVREAVGVSLRVALAASALATLLGAPAGFWIATHEFRGRRFAEIALNTATALFETGAEGTLRLANWNRDGALDLVYVMKSGTASGRTEVHVLSGAGGFRNWILNVATPLPPSAAFDEFRFADFNGDGVLDLFVVKKQNTSSGRTELHVVNGANNLGSFLLQVATPLPTY